MGKIAHVPSVRKYQTQIRYDDHRQRQLSKHYLFGKQHQWARNRSRHNSLDDHFVSLAKPQIMVPNLQGTACHESQTPEFKNLPKLDECKWLLATSCRNMNVKCDFFVVRGKGRHNITTTWNYPLYYVCLRRRGWISDLKRLSSLSCIWTTRLYTRTCVSIVSRHTLSKSATLTVQVAD